MHTFASGAVREEKDGKGRMDLLPMCALIRLSKHYEKGTAAHGERNWEKGIPIHSFIDSALRHIAKYVDGQTDEDHLCAAAWNILGAMWTEEKHPELQDIPSRVSRCVPLASDGNGGTNIAPDTEGQEKATEAPSECEYYRPMAGSPRCTGTRELDPCSCGGNTHKCDFYPEVRNR